MIIIKFHFYYQYKYKILIRLKSYSTKLLVVEDRNQQVKSIKKKQKQKFGTQLHNEI